MAGERPLVDLLRSGELEAVFTPFMPDGFFDADSDLRQLLPQCRRDEVAYFRDVGYVPGMHLLGIKPDILRAHPWVGQSLSAALDASAAMWLHKRRKYADTTPWILDELIQTSRDLPEGWDRNGLQANQPMVTDFWPNCARSVSPSAACRRRNCSPTADVLEHTRRLHMKIALGQFAVRPDWQDNAAICRT